MAEETATLAFRVDQALAAEVRGAALATGISRDDIGRLGIALALQRLRRDHNAGEPFAGAEVGALRPGRRKKK